MKIDSEALKDFYESFLEEVSSPTRANCPSPELLLKSLRFRITKRKQRKIVNHLFCCVHCFREFEFMIESIRKEKEIKQEMEQRFLLLPDKKRLTKRNKSTPFSSFPRKWLYSTAAIMIIVIISIFMFKTPEIPKFRRTRASPLQIIFPNEIQVPLPKLYFEWGIDPQSEYYIIEVFDETLLLIWKSDKLTMSSFTPPKDFLDRLKSEKTYFWMVTAYSNNKKKCESRLIDFFLNK